MRENPPTNKANKVCTGKPVAHFSRTHVGSIPEKVSDGGTGKPVAVTLSTEFHVFLHSTVQKEDPNRATTEERSRNDKSWKMSLNREGIQGPMNQRLDFR